MIFVEEELLSCMGNFYIEDSKDFLNFSTRSFKKTSITSGAESLKNEKKKQLKPNPNKSQLTPSN